MFATLLLLFSLPGAQAAPIGTLGLASSTGTLGPAAALSGRVRFDSRIQLGARVEGALARSWYLDGWPVREGNALAGVASLTLPLVSAEKIQVDLEIDGGLRQLWASDTDAPTDRATVVLADVSPMATLPLGRSAAVRLGWKQITHVQIQPRTDLEAQGALLRAAAVVVASEDLQLGLEGMTGGVFGFDGNGGKAVGQVGLLARWVPGASRTYTNH